MRIKSTLMLLSGLILGLGSSQYCRAEQDDGNRKFQVDTKENKDLSPDQIRERKNMDEQERQRQFQIQQATLQAKAEADRLERDREKIQEERRQREAILAEREANEKRRLEEIERLKLEKIQAEIKKKAETIVERKDQIVALKHEESRLVDAQAEAKRKVNVYNNKIDGLKKSIAEYQREYNDWRTKNSTVVAQGVNVRNDTTEQMGKVQRKLDTSTAELERSTKGQSEANKDLSEANTKLEQNRSQQTAFKREQETLKKGIQELGGTFEIPDDSILVKSVRPAKVEEAGPEKSVKLKDGTVLKAAKIMDFGDTYAVKGPDGKVTNVKKDDVDEIK